MEHTPTIDNDVEAMLHHAIERYVQWLNQDWDGKGDAHESWVKFEDFFGEHGDTGIIARSELDDWDQIVWHVKAYYGDEGGPALLTLWWDAYFEAIYDPPLELLSKKPSKYVGQRLVGFRLRHAVQEFDTYRSMFLSEGLLLRPDGKFGED